MVLMGDGRAKDVSEKRSLLELELELILSKMAQKPVLRGLVGVRV